MNNLEKTISELKSTDALCPFCPYHSSTCPKKCPSTKKIIEWLSKEAQEENIYLNVDVELNKRFLIKTNGKSQEQIIEETRKRLVEEVKKGNIEVMQISAECGGYTTWSLKYDD